MDYSFVKNTFRSQNFNYFVSFSQISFNVLLVENTHVEIQLQKTKSILSQYKDEIPVINLKEAPPVGAAEDESDEAYLKDDEVQVITSEYFFYTIDLENVVST